jgi:hypothetical protein
MGLDPPGEQGRPADHSQNRSGGTQIPAPKPGHQPGRAQYEAQKKNKGSKISNPGRFSSHPQDRRQSYGLQEKMDKGPDQKGIQPASQSQGRTPVGHVLAQYRSHQHGQKQNILSLPPGLGRLPTLPRPFGHTGDCIQTGTQGADMAAKKSSQYQSNNENDPYLQQAGRDLATAQPLPYPQQRIQTDHGRQRSPLLPGRKAKTYSEQKKEQKTYLDHPLLHILNS